MWTIYICDGQDGIDMLNTGMLDRNGYVGNIKVWWIWSYVMPYKYMHLLGMTEYVGCIGVC